MKCQKTMGTFRGRNYTAWFSDEIAIPEGSYKFKNLPGLVVALSSDDGDYQFGLISIKKNDRKIEEIPALPLKNREEYLKKLKIVKENPSFPMQQEDQASTMEQKDYINGKEVTQSEKYKLFNEYVWEFYKGQY